MRVEQSGVPLLLCAEILHRGARVISHTVEISESLVIVPTERDAYIGDQAIVRFSFPGLVEPFSLETQVIARRRGNPYGRSTDWALGFVLYRAEEQARLRGLLRRIQGQSGAESSDCRPVRPYRILLVDDNELTRQTFSFAARKHFGAGGGRVAVEVVSDSRDAWDELHRAPYDLAIVDYFLSTSDGAQLIADLRRDSELGQLPIFAASMGGPEAREASLAAGANVFISKPLVVRTLFPTLSRLTGLLHPPTSLRRSAG